MGRYTICLSVKDEETSEVFPVPPIARIFADLPHARDYCELMRQGPQMLTCAEVARQNLQEAIVSEVGGEWRMDLLASALGNLGFGLSYTKKEDHHHVEKTASMARSR